MRIGSLARSQGRLVALLVAAASTAMLPLATFGQVRNASYDVGQLAWQPRTEASAVQRARRRRNDCAGFAVCRCQRQPNGRAGRLLRAMRRCGDGCDCYGGGGGCDGCGYGNCGPGCQGGYPGCCPMGAGGTDPPIGYDLMNDVGIEGNLVDQRGPHYFDIRAEAVFLQRDKSFDQNIDFTSLNVGNGPGRALQQSVGYRRPATGLPRHRPLRHLPAVGRRIRLHGHFRLERQRVGHGPDEQPVFAVFAASSGDRACSASSPAGVNLPGGPNPFTERASHAQHRAFVRFANGGDQLPPLLARLLLRAFPARCWPASATRR